MAKRLTFRLEGRKEEDGFVRVADFAAFLANVLRSLQEVERDVAKPKTTIYRLHSLSTGSAVVEVEAVAKRNKPDRAAQVMEAFAAGLRAVQEGREAPPGLSVRTLQSFRGLVEPLGSSVSRITVTDEGVPFDVTSELERQLDRVSARDFAAMGSVSGHVDALSVHQEWVFSLYPDIYPGRVACHFGSEHLDAVREAVRRHVTVTGRLLYHPGAPFPHRLDVERIEIHPPVDQLPTLRSLLGAVPDLTGGLESVEYLRRKRHAEA